MWNSLEKMRVRARRSARVLVLGAALLAGCSGGGPSADRSAIDPALERFVAGDYERAVEMLNELVAAGGSDELLREVYYYLGRSYLELGETDRAVEAFSAGVTYGDTGPCVQYLEELQARVETRPGSISRTSELTRRQLAAALIRRGFLGDDGSRGAASDPDAEMRRVAARGWMPALPDGSLHGGDAVTRASLFVILSRVATDLRVDRSVLDEFRVTLVSRGRESVSGNDATALLDAIERLRN